MKDKQDLANNKQKWSEISKVFTLKDQHCSGFEQVYNVIARLPSGQAAICFVLVNFIAQNLKYIDQDLSEVKIYNCENE